MTSPRQSGESAPLQRLLATVAAKVPAYRTLDYRPGEPIERFPVVHKTQMRSNYEDYISDDFAAIRKPLASFLVDPNICRGDYKKVHFNKHVIVEETTGSSGEPFRCPKTVADRVRLGMGVWRQRQAVDPLLDPSRFLRFVHMPVGRGPIAYDPFDVSRESLQRLYDFVQAGAFRWLHSHGSLLMQHAEALAGGPWCPDVPALKVVENTGHFLQAEVAARLRAFLNVEVLDQYGLMEVWAVSLTCRRGVHHVCQENVHVEILDDDDRPTVLGEFGRVVVSSLQLSLMPLVRYATGDWARFRRDPCGCGLDGPALEIMEGRDNEIIKGVEGRRFGNAVFAEAAKCAVYRTGCDALRHLRIVQRGVNDFEVRTNRIENPDGYLAELARATLDHLGHGVRFRHVVASDQEIASLQCGKPGLFTCLC